MRSPIVASSGAVSASGEPLVPGMPHCGACRSGRAASRSPCRRLWTTSGSLGFDQRNAQRPDPVGVLTAITHRFGTQTCSDSLDPSITDLCPRPSSRVQLEPAKLPDLHQALQMKPGREPSVCRSPRACFGDGAVVVIALRAHQAVLIRSGPGRWAERNGVGEHQEPDYCL